MATTFNPTKNRTMTQSEFLAFAKAEKDSRDARGEAEAEARYGLVQIGSNGNDPRSFGCMNTEGVIYKIGADGRTYNHETGQPCPDQLRLDPINARLEAMGETLRVRTKHFRIIRTLWLALPEEM